MLTRIVPVTGPKRKPPVSVSSAAPGIDAATAAKYVTTKISAEIIKFALTYSRRILRVLYIFSGLNFSRYP